MKDQHGVCHPSLGIADRFTEGRVMQAQLGQGFPRFEMEVMGDVVALLRRQSGRRLLGAQLCSRDDQKDQQSEICHSPRPVHRSFPPCPKLNSRTYSPGALPAFWAAIQAETR